MPKKTPAQHFHDLFKRWTAGTTEEEREVGKKKAYEWLAKNGKKESDISTLVAQAVADDLAANPPPPPPDPRDTASVRFDPKRHNPASLVENTIKLYATMSEHVLVIYCLWVPFTHVYTRFAIAPRIVLVSENPNSGKSTALELARHLVHRPNEEVLGTGAAVRDFISGGPCTVLLDEMDHLDKDAERQLQQIFNIGHKKRGAKKSLMVGGRRKLIDLYAPMMVAGVGHLRNFLGAQQKSRAYVLEMLPYTEATKPARDFYVEGEFDEAAANGVYTLIHRWAGKAELNPKPPMPAGVITRYADNVRGLLAVADACGEDWGRRARAALIVLLEKEKAEHPRVVILRHGLAIFEMLELERIPSTRMNRELLRLDLPDVNWKRYRGPEGGQGAHALTLSEQAALLKQSGIESKVMKPIGGGKGFRGYERAWFEEAVGKEKPAPRLRLITPQAE